MVPVPGWDRLREEQVEGIMTLVFDTEHLKCPLAFQIEAFMRLGLELSGI